MTVAELEKRLEALEQAFAAFKESKEVPANQHWLQRIRGRWAGDPVFKEIIDLGREYRESLRPKDDENGES